MQRWSTRRTLVPGAGINSSVPHPEGIASDGARQCGLTCGACQNYARARRLSKFRMPRGTKQ
eukprot:5697414-Amphidinium_carterae.1